MLAIARRQSEYLAEAKLVTLQGMVKSAFSGVLQTTC